MLYIMINYKYCGTFYDGLEYGLNWLGLQINIDLKLMGGFSLKNKFGIRFIDCKINMFTSIDDVTYLMKCLP